MVVVVSRHATQSQTHALARRFRGKPYALRASVPVLQSYRGCRDARRGHAHGAWRLVPSVASSHLHLPCAARLWRALVQHWCQEKGLRSRVTILYNVKACPNLDRPGAARPATHGETYRDMLLRAAEEQRLCCDVSGRPSTRAVVRAPSAPPASAAHCPFQREQTR